MDREARHAPVHGVTKSQTWLSDWTELKIHFGIPTFNVMVLDGGAFWEWLGHDGGVPLNGISALISETHRAP